MFFFFFFFFFLVFLVLFIFTGGLKKNKVFRHHAKSTDDASPELLGFLVSPLIWLPAIRFLSCLAFGCLAVVFM